MTGMTDMTDTAEESDDQIIITKKSTFLFFIDNVETLSTRDNLIILTKSNGYVKWKDDNREVIKFSSVESINIDDKVSYTSLWRRSYLIAMIVSLAMTIMMFFLIILSSDDIDEAGENIGIAISSIISIVVLILLAYYSYIMNKRKLSIRTKNKTISMCYTENDRMKIDDLINKWQTGP